MFLYVPEFEGSQGLLVPILKIRALTKARFRRVWFHVPSRSNERSPFSNNLIHPVTSIAFAKRILDGNINPEDIFRVVGSILASDSKLSKVDDCLYTLLLSLTIVGHSTVDDDRL